MERVNASGARRRGGNVAVVSILSLEDLDGGADRYRVSSTTSAGAEPDQVTRAQDASAVRATVSEWLDEVLDEQVRGEVTP